MSRGMLGQLATIVGGTLHGDDDGFDGVCTDTRKLKPGNLFVALRGPHFDGNQYVAHASAQGAAGALVEQLSDSELPQVRVKDCLSALGQFAYHWRTRLDPKVVAVTGSNGKTTVKEMIATILRRVAPTHATAGNLNNEIGVPLTLLALQSKHQLAVIEMGANHAGEIARLTAMTAPSAGIVTNAAPAHLEGFGSIAGVASAKGELFEGLRPNATAIINRDDAYFETWRAMAGQRRIVSFGRHREADFRVGEIVQLRNGNGDGIRLNLRTPDGERDMQLPLPGQHNALNAAGAAAAAWVMGAGLDDIVAGLGQIVATPGRLAILRASCGARLIDDTYNANPASLQVALDFLAAQPGKGWLVLGDMGELGEQAQALHAMFGLRAKQAGVERLFAIGPLSAAAVDSFGSGAQSFDDTSTLISVLQEQLHEGVNLLVKASRAMQMEQVTKALRDDKVEG